VSAAVSIASAWSDEVVFLRDCGASQQLNLCGAHNFLIFVAEVSDLDVALFNGGAVFSLSNIFLGLVLNTDTRLKLFELAQENSVVSFVNRVLVLSSLCTDLIALHNKLRWFNRLLVD